MHEIIYRIYQACTYHCQNAALKGVCYVASRLRVAYSTYVAKLNSWVCSSRSRRHSDFKTTLVGRRHRNAELGLRFILVKEVRPSDPSRSSRFTVLCTQFQNSKFWSGKSFPWQDKASACCQSIVFTARLEIHSHSQIFSYGRSIFCLPHRPNFSDIFDLCLHWLSVVRGMMDKN